MKQTIVKYKNGGVTKEAARYSAKMKKRVERQQAMDEIAKAAEKLGLVITPVCNACIDDGFLVTMTSREAKEITIKTIHWLQ